MCGCKVIGCGEAVDGFGLRVIGRARRAIIRTGSQAFGFAWADVITIARAAGANLIFKITDARRLMVRRRAFFVLNANRYLADFFRNISFA